MNGGRVIVLGSINLDIQLGVAALPLPGETARSLSVRRGLGGKGANQAVAASRAGASAALIGAVGEVGGIVQLIRHAPASRLGRGAAQDNPERVRDWHVLSAAVEIKLRCS
jgi:ribokinase